jgi:hypothetical protein
LIICSSEISFVVGKYKPSNFASLCQEFSSLFPENLRISLSVSEKKPAGIWIGIVLNLSINLGVIDILAILGLPVHAFPLLGLLFLSAVFCSFQSTNFIFLL